VAHFDGTSWSRVATPTIDNNDRLAGIVALTPSNIIAVGTTGDGWTSLVLHWNGSAWVREAAPDANLTAAAVGGPNTFWGGQATVRHKRVRGADVHNGQDLIVAQIMTGCPMPPTPADRRSGRNGNLGAASFIGGAGRAHPRRMAV
jgi:hypothetical protein